ncbi:MAG: acylphosphatase [Anaerolineae bacterium]|nr:acylphosphatase [Anaerolineae bacterium]
MENPIPNERLHLWAAGRVQAVGFRAFVAQAANNLGLTGWVRNVGYDQVEAIAEGQRADLDEFAAIVRAGPRASRVEESRIEWLPAGNEFIDFTVRSSR